ncbi:1-deoxy-D-xylulose-5-phosphate synthase 2 [Actinomycetes bacterium]|nr:1-deoxy-D-xylulose-5-phosphate synthase 2 [Actinomycetes bacterium]
MGILQSINSPTDLKKIPAAQIPTLAKEVREFLIDRVSKTGGHLGPNLGVVELTIAIHRVFDSPKDSIVWDTGHQSYVHKMFTGRLDKFNELRKKDGISGYPARGESAHDIVENSHASTALSWADGIARAYEQTGELKDRHVVAVVGDGSLTGGMSWEALNNIASQTHRPLVIIVNDNGRSYSPTIGGLSTHLASLRTNDMYEKVLDWGKETLLKSPMGRPVFEALHGMKKGIKDVFAPQGLFEDLGLKYLGPVDGHDEDLIENALQVAKRFNGPVMVHVITEKGKGYAPALEDEAEKFHATGIINPSTGKPVNASATTWTSVFSDELVAIGKERKDIVALTAAMLGPTGLDKFAQQFPDRIFDVGIAEQHATTSAAGMAFGGLHPVVAIYATFLNRAFDQLLLDVALHNAGVTFVLDRAGITGDDGASHNGMWDLSILQVVPNLMLSAPRDASTLRELLRESVVVKDRPTVLRFPKGAIAQPVPAQERIEGIDILNKKGEEDVLLVSIGAMANLALDVAQRLSDQGVGVTVIDPRWIKPLPNYLSILAAKHRLIAVVEDNSKSGGVAAGISQFLRDKNIYTPQRDFGIPEKFLNHGTRAQIMSEIGLTAQDISREIIEAVARLDNAFSERKN